MFSRLLPCALGVAIGMTGAPQSSVAGAWTQEKGKGLVILTGSFSEADERFLVDGSTAGATDFSKTEVRAYLEYGLTDWATLVAQPEWRIKETGPSRGENVNGFGRFDFGARVRVWRDDASVFSVQGSLRVPGASDDLAPANGGDTDYEMDGRILYGKGFPVLGRHGFTDIQLGYRVRFGDPADELRLDITSGIDVTPKILALLQSFNTISVGDAQGVFRETRENKISASVVYRFDETWAVQAGAIFTVTGQDTLRERGLIVGLWRSF